MENVLNKIIGIFESIELPFRRQGTYGENEEYPPTFMTYWNINSPFEDYGDDSEHSIVHEYMIYLYSLDESELYSRLDEFIRLAKTQNFIVQGKGQDITCDDKRYVGRALRIYYRENI